MQQSEPQWDPVTIDRVMSSGNRLLILYLFLTLVFFLVRVIQISRFLWVSRKSSSSSALGPGRFALASTRSASLKHAAVLAILLSLLTLVSNIVSELHGAASAKFFSWNWWVNVVVAEDLTVFATGVLVCTILYAGYALLDGKLSRMQIVFDPR